MDGLELIQIARQRLGVVSPSLREAFERAAAAADAAYQEASSTRFLVWSWRRGTLPATLYELMKRHPTNTDLTDAVISELKRNGVPEYDAERLREPVAYLLGASRDICNAVPVQPRVSVPVASAPVASAPSLAVSKSASSGVMERRPDGPPAGTERPPATAAPVAPSPEELAALRAEWSRQRERYRDTLSHVRREIIELLDSLDMAVGAQEDMDRAAQSTGPSNDAERERSSRYYAVQLLTTRNHLLRLLDTYFGLKRIAIAPHTPFDSATMTLASAIPTGDQTLDQCIAQEIRCGYTTREGKTYRPASVHVFRYTGAPTSSPA